MNQERSALIGHSGFVGGTLLAARPFSNLFNSSNIGTMAGDYDLVVCAGVSAAKWIANRDPEADAAGIRKLTGVLEGVRAGEFILISTIDVYPDPASNDDETSRIDPAANHPYGRNRYALELWIRERFPDARVIRLPALFGFGLRKNALYDLLHGNNVNAINPFSHFQWYPMRRLADDVERVRRADLRLVNLFPEPVGMNDIVDAFFPGVAAGAPAEPASHYALRTKHAALFGGEGGYMLSAESVLGEMARFVAASRRSAGVA